MATELPPAGRRPGPASKRGHTDWDELPWHTGPSNPPIAAVLLFFAGTAAVPLAAFGYFFGWHRTSVVPGGPLRRQFRPGSRPPVPPATGQWDTA